MKLHWQILVALGLGAKRNWHIFFALIAGIFFGLLFPYHDGHPTIANFIFNVIGKIFISLIQMIVIPLVVSTIIVGIASLGDSRQLGKIGLKMIIYYTIITVAAVSIGAGLSLAINPGVRVQSEINQVQAKEVQKQVMLVQHDKNKIVQEFKEMLPENPIASLANGKLIPIILFTIIFGCALALIGDINRPVVSFFESMFAATMKVTDWVMVIAAPGICALTANAVAHSGLKLFSSMYPYIVQFYWAY